MKKLDRYRPKDPYRQDAWHKARLDLAGFIVQNRSRMTFKMLDEAERITKTFDKYPSHSIKRGWLVELTYGYMDYWSEELTKLLNNKTQRVAA
jgi:hypothetical protein